MVNSGNKSAHSRYTLSLSGTDYDTDVWSDPDDIGALPRGIVVRDNNMPRYIWKEVDKLFTNTGIVDLDGKDANPDIAMNRCHGEYGGGDFRDTYLIGRNVYVTFSSRSADPGPGWDTVGNDGPYLKIDGEIVYDPDGNEVRDPKDLVPTIVIKQVDP